MTIFQVKPIKPPGLKVDAVRLAILNALKKEGTVEKKLLEGTTKYWQGAKPTFTAEVSLAGGDAQLLVGVGGNAEAAAKWVRVNDGTRGGYWVFPRRARALRFQPGYDAGSTPNTLDVKPARRYGEFIYRPRAYIKKGIAARNWTIVVLKERYVPFREAVNKALEQGLKQGGWK